MVQIDEQSCLENTNISVNTQNKFTLSESLFTEKEF